MNVNVEIVAWLHDELGSSQVITDRIKNILIASKQKSAKHYTIPLCKYEPPLGDFTFNKEFTTLLQETEYLCPLPSTRKDR